MYLVRQESDIVVGIDTEFRPICQCLELTAITPNGPGRAAPGFRSGTGSARSTGSPSIGTSRSWTCAATAAPVRWSGCRSSATALVRDVAVTLMARKDLPLTPQTAAWANPGALMRLVQQVLALYPIPFLLVTLVVLLQRPDDPHAWLLALMLGGFIAGAGVTEFEYRVPSWMRGSLLAFSLLLGVPLAGLTYAFFAVFPAHSPLDRRLPWLKTVGLALGYSVAAVLAVGALVGQGSYFRFWLDERFGAWTAPVGILLLIYGAGFFLLAVVSLVQNAFGPVDVRRKTRVILFGLLVGRHAHHRVAVGGRRDRDAALRAAALVLGVRDPAALRDSAVARLRGGEAPGDGDSGAAAPQRALPAGSPGTGDGGGPCGHRRDAGLRAPVRQRALPWLDGPHARRPDGGVALWRPDGAGRPPRVAAGDGAAGPCVLPRVVRRAAPADDAGGADAHGQRSHHACRDDRPRGAAGAASEDAARVPARRRRLDISGSGARGVVGRRRAPAHCACPAGGSRAARTAAVARSRRSSSPERRGPRWPPCRQRRWCR